MKLFENDPQEFIETPETIKKDIRFLVIILAFNSILTIALIVKMIMMR